MVGRLGFVTYRIRDLRRLFRGRGVDGNNQLLDATIREAADAAGINHMKANATEAGHAFAVTVKERVEHKIKTMRPCDLTTEEFKAWRRDASRQRERERGRRRRAKQSRQRAAERESLERAKHLDLKEEVIFSILDRPFTVDELASKLAAHKAFLNKGRRLPAKSVKRAIQRAIKSLEKAAKIEKEERKSVRGRPLFVVQLAGSVVVPFRAKLI